MSSLNTVQDVRDLLAFVFNYFGPASRAGALPDHVVQCVRRLEAAVSCQSNDLALMRKESASAITGVHQGWSGWAVQYAGRLPAIYGKREIALLNWEPREGASLIHLAEVEHVGADVEAIP